MNEFVKRKNWFSSNLFLSSAAGNRENVPLKKKKTFFNLSHDVKTNLNPLSNSNSVIVNLSEEISKMIKVWIWSNPKLINQCLFCVLVVIRIFFENEKATEFWWSTHL